MVISDELRERLLLKFEEERFWRREKRRAARAREQGKNHGVEVTLTGNEWLTQLIANDLLCVDCGSPYERLGYLRSLKKGGGVVQANCVPMCLACATRRTQVVAEVA